jgi:hypothetical protein
VRGGGLEGLAEAGTLYALCEGGARAPFVERLGGREAADVVEGGSFDGIFYRGGRFTSLGQEMRRRIEALAASEGGLPDTLPEGPRIAVLVVRES